MSLPDTLVGLAAESGAKDLALCQKAVREAAQDQRSMVFALLETGQVDEKIFALKLGETIS